MTPFDLILLFGLAALTLLALTSWLNGRRRSAERNALACEVSTLRANERELSAKSIRSDAELAHERTRLADAQAQNSQFQSRFDALQCVCDRLREQHSALSARTEYAENANAALKEAFKLSSADAMREIVEEAARRNAETQVHHDALTQERLAAQLTPLAETLDRFRQHVAAIEQSRASDQGGLKEQTQALMQASMATQNEAKRLSGALRRGAGVQGRWGEQTLRNVLEHAGLQNRFDFNEQLVVDGTDGRKRPDVTVRMPGGGLFVIDAKCSLNAFLEAQESNDDATKVTALQRHAASLRTHMSGLSAREYWDQFKHEGSPDFVAMFVPGDGFLVAALDHVPDLLSQSMERRVLIVTPTTLFALCKAVAYGWRVEEQAKNSDEIAKLGKELYKRLATMGDHAGAVGKSLVTAVSKYNDFVGSLESQVLTQARRFEDLKVEHEARQIPSLSAVSASVRPIIKLSTSP